MALPVLQILSIDSIEELPNSLTRKSKYFTLLLAWNAPENAQNDLAELLAPIVRSGLAYFCAWGERCEQVHDAIDDSFIEHELEDGEAYPFLMTTWHQEESLEEAFWFFRMVAVPTENFVLANLERFAVAVGNPQWAHEMTANLSKTYFG